MVLEGFKEFLPFYFQVLSGREGDRGPRENDDFESCGVLLNDPF